jgi:hypothetical protein
MTSGMVVLHIGLLVVSFLVVLNGDLRGRCTAYADAALGAALIGLLAQVQQLAS